MMSTCSTPMEKQAFKLPSIGNSPGPKGIRVMDFSGLITPKNGPLFGAIDLKDPEFRLTMSRIIVA